MEEEDDDLLSSSFRCDRTAEKATRRGKKKKWPDHWLVQPRARCRRRRPARASLRRDSDRSVASRPRAPARNSLANQASGRAATRRARSAALRAVAVASATGSCVCLQAMLRSWRVAVESNGRGSSADRRGERTEARGRACVVSDPAGSCSVPWSKKMR